MQSESSTWPDLQNELSVSDREIPSFTQVNGLLMARWIDHIEGDPPLTSRWCREDPAACRVGSEGLKQRGRQPIRRGSGAAAPVCDRGSFGSPSDFGAQRARLRRDPSP